MNRKEFLRQSAIAAIGTWLVPDFVKAYEHRSPLRQNDKILVVLQFSGGNDGLNTIIPYRNDIYYRERPRLAIQATESLPFTDEMAFHPALSKLRKWYDDGYFTVLSEVGYPNPDRSHFRSMDIWQTASDSADYLRTGWIGRYLDAQCNGACQAYHAVEIDDQLSLSMKGTAVKGLAVSDPQRLHNQTQNKFYQELAKVNHEEYHNVDYLYKTLAETISSSDYLYAKTKVTEPPAVYPAHDLGRKMRTVSGFIRSGVEASVFYVSHGSFDTHVNQKPQQDRLLGQYAEALDAFLADMKKLGRLDDVIVMTFSEFGRRVRQNASNGTDHGTANCLFWAGGTLKPVPALSAAPDLSRLDEGDLRYRTDFRDVYATLLDKWLQVDSTAILGRKFPGLPLA